MKSTASAPPLLGCIPNSTALSGVTTFTAPRVSATLTSGSSTSAAIMAITPHTPLAHIVSSQANNLSTDAIAVGPSSPPIPLKLAQKIWRNEFIDVQELLLARLGIPEPTLLDVLTKLESTKPKKEIKTIQQWALCFNSYITVLAITHPQRVGDLLAYSSIIINASSEYEDTPWLQYDARFRRQAATDPNRPWATIDASLWTTCFANARSRPRCRDCKEMGHETCKPAATYRPTGSYRYQPYSTSRPICKKFNYAWCDLSPCNFQHIICLNCQKPNHKVGQCPELNKPSEPFRPPKNKGP